jgi:hypothetical protein
MKGVEYNSITKIENNRLYLQNELLNNYNQGDEEIFCENVRFNLILTRDTKDEQFYYLSPNQNDENYFADVINTGSAFVRVNLTGQGCLPEEVHFKHLTGGKNGVLGLTPADFIGYFRGLDDNRGIGIFEAFEDISLIAAPDVLVFEDLVHKDKEKALADIFIVQRALVDQCERMGNRFVILDAPDIQDTIKLMKWTGKFDSSFAALYCPRVQMINPEDITGLTTIMVPPSGPIAGVYAECDAEEGIFRAPANKYIKGAVGLSRIIENEEIEILYPRGINCLRYIPGRGINIWGARTLSSDTEWKYINVRRTFSAIRDAIRLGSGWAVFEPNDNALRKRIVRHLTAFLLDLWRKGYMAGTVPAQGFFVRCDDELNPPENVDAGIVTVEIGICIAKPAEFLVMRIQANSEQHVIVTEE